MSHNANSELDSYLVPRPTVALHGIQRTMVAIFFAATLMKMHAAVRADTTRVCPPCAD